MLHQPKCLLLKKLWCTKPLLCYHHSYYMLLLFHILKLKDYF